MLSASTPDSGNGREGREGKTFTGPLFPQNPARPFGTHLRMSDPVCVTFSSPSPRLVERNHSCGKGVDRSNSTLRFSLQVDVPFLLFAPSHAVQTHARDMLDLLHVFSQDQQPQIPKIETPLKSVVRRVGSAGGSYIGLCCLCSVGTPRVKFPLTLCREIDWCSCSVFVWNVNVAVTVQGESIRGAGASQPTGNNGDIEMLTARGWSPRTTLCG